MRIPPGAINEHHIRHHAHIVLPAMSQLVPPFSLNDFRFVDLVDGPEVGVILVEEDGLEDVVFVGDGRFMGRWRRGRVLAELMLVICAIKGHFDLVHVFRVGMRIIHWSKTSGFVLGTFHFGFRESDLVFLLFGFGRGAEGVGEVGFVVFLEVGGVGVGDCDVVEESGAAEDEAFFPVCGFSEQLFGVVGEDAHDEFVVGFRGCGGVFVLHA